MRERLQHLHTLLKVAFGEGFLMRVAA
jgi:hypothetical protein